MISFFDKSVIRLFQHLVDLRYTVIHMEIRENNMIAGVSIATENLKVFFGILSRDHAQYQWNQNCSMQIYRLDDEAMEEPITTMVHKSIMECTDQLLYEDLLENIAKPAYSCN